MYSTSAISEMSRDAAINAARVNSVPFTLEQEDLDFLRENVDDLRKVKTILGRLPNLGQLIPKGYRRVDYRMVDSSGFGGEHEAALTVPTFIRSYLKADRAYAIIEAGQFQVVIGEFVKDKRVKGNAAKFEEELTSDELENYGD